MISEKKNMEINRFIKILSVLMFVLSLCMKLNSVSAAKVRCIDRERQALLKFKHGLVDDHGILSSWGSEEVIKECCKWKGILCSNRTGHVVSLDLHVPPPPSGFYVYLQAAKLSPALLELQHLNYLDLSFIDFGRSEIPRFIGSFNKLRHLNLSNSNFTGEVPCELGNLTNLHTLNLHLNDLRIKNLECLSHLSFLSYLDLSGNDFGRSEIPRFFGSFNKLRHLKLSYSNFTGEVPCELGNLTNLHTLDLCGNDIRIKNLDWLSHLSLLSYLDLSNNDFGRSEIPRFFGSFNKLRHLKLSYSNFTGEVPCELGNLTNLHTLDLCGNDIRIKNLEWLSHLSLLSYLGLNGVNLMNQTSWLHSITRFSFLEKLFLSNCQLPNTMPSFDIFTNSSLPYLSILDLSSNDLTSSFAFHWLFNLSASLTYIDLSYNRLDGLIPDAFGELIFLEELWLNNNTFHGGVPKSFGNLSHLYYLDISYNELNGSLTAVTKLSSLRSLYLNNNKLNGFHTQSPGLPSSLERLFLSYNQSRRLPEGIEKLSKLQYLDMSSNLLEGTITKSFLSNFANLKYLDLSLNSLAFNLSSDWIPHFQLERILLSHCYLGPHFPNWIQTQSTLEVLDLSFAGISDALPNWLWNMSSLSRLDLSHNDISGKISNLSSKSIFREVVDLSYNNLSGPIPLFLFLSGELKMSKNMFSGSIFHFCTIPEVSSILVLDLSDNQLEGELPNCWLNTTFLFILDLANNKFSGKISPTLGSLDKLEVLHLRNNNFIDELPSTLRNCTRLRMLDVGGNKLTGNIPAWIGTHLTSLTVLSLRRNEFDGVMPSTICRLANIHVLDLSRNNISGRISRCLNNITALVQKNSSIEYGDWKFYNADYVNNAFVQWKGQDTEYKTLGLLKGIDLSRNKLFGPIPQEFSALRGLVFLNLSRNHLTGNIISNIGQMEMLECLDLSRNQLSGKIPNSLAHLNFLGVLDLSYNNLTRKIPLGTQLQSFNSSAYADNSQLCGKPLTECPEDISSSSVTDHGKGNIFEEDDGFITRDFYICMAFGFITGFWVVVITLFIKHSWRHSYFNFWNNVGNWMYVTTTIYVTRFKRKFQT
ncbi:LRR receptor-like serine/threonine-protein kinase FLS2 [Olea europaea var. sylvestris]|uniref:LRR receptor-like serine/threonine-protein kinase FLS2 n=1 Tax=Olea europaea var. sylvestris TaxID=158386 RepID=UPI000C1D4072|nr:LRR receptor-like serine/threonine-protein kinase FLS2 [Olea europaea var. sylvestris]